MPEQLEVFLKRARDHQKSIEDAQDSMVYAYKVISKEKKLGLGQYTRIIDSICVVGEPIREFYKLLDTPEQLPPIIRPIRYSLLITLHYLDTLVDSLISSIHSFHRAGMTSPMPEVTCQRQEILSQLDALLQSKDAIKYTIDQLLWEQQ